MTRSDARALPPLPSLAPFLEQLAALVSSPFCPPSLFLHDPKQAPLLVDAVLQLWHVHCAAASTPAEPRVGDLLPTVAHLDLAQVHSVKQALDRILAQFSGYDIAAADAQEWDDKAHGVHAWDARPLEDLVVVEEMGAARKRRSSESGDTSGRKRKRARRGSTASQSDSEQDGAEAPAETDTDPSGSAQGPTAWTLAWRSDGETADQKPSAAIAPLRNSLDAFHDALRTIFTFADGHSSDQADSSGLPRRRYILLEHGELLSELAGAGKASGAARETGVGVTFASTIHRLAELVSRRL